MKKILVLILCCLNLALAAVANVFEGFAEPYPVNDAIIFNNSLALATANGIRFVDASGNTEMRMSANGLGATSFASLAVVGDFLYTISENGSIARFSSNRNIEFLNSSYEESGSVAVPSAVAVGGNFIVIAFKNKLAFFDTKSKSFLTSISKIGSAMLDANPPTCVLVSGDSLFVGIGKSAYYRKMDWKNLNKDRFLADPDSWKEIKFEEPVMSMTIFKGKLKARSVSGSYYYKNEKKFSASENFSVIVANGVNVEHRGAYINGDSRAKFVLESDGVIYLVGSNFVGVVKCDEFFDFTQFNHYMLGGTYEMTSLPNGGMIVSGLNSKLSRFDGYVFLPPMLTNELGFSNVLDGPGHLIKALSALPSGEVLYALWGYGLVVFSDANMAEIKFKVLANDGTCIENFLEGFMVPVSATAAPDGSGFLVSYWSKNNYGIAYVDLFGDVYCASERGSSEFSGPIVARMFENNSYEVFVSANAAQTVNGNGSLDRFVMRSPKSVGELSVVEKSNLKTPDHGYVVDLAFAADSVLWVATYSKIGHWESGDSVLVPHRVSHFSGASYSSIAIDPRGNLWVGSNGDGLYHVTRKKNSNDTLVAEHFKTRQGLLNDNIYDLALDSVTGSLWMAHNVGVTRLMRSDLRNASTFMTDSTELKVTVFPNPFRPKKHSQLTFAFVAENARISIFNAGGNLVKSLADDDLVGGNAAWDGRDGSGRLVAPGTYTYLITIGGKKKKMGRLLIVH